jgi:hypothetical protein
MIRAMRKKQRETIEWRYPHTMNSSRSNLVGWKVKRILANEFSLYVKNKVGVMWR